MTLNMWRNMLLNTHGTDRARNGLQVCADRRQLACQLDMELMAGFIGQHMSYGHGAQ